MYKDRYGVLLLFVWVRYMCVDLVVALVLLSFDHRGAALVGGLFVRPLGLDFLLVLLES